MYSMHGTALLRVLAAAAALVLGCSAGPAGQGGAADPAKLAADAAEFWVDPDSPAARQAQRWREEGRTADAALMERIAGRPVASWPPGETDPAAEVGEVTRAAATDGLPAVLVAYNIPHRDCGQYSQGGAASAAAYRRWIGSFAEAIGDAEAIVILEPDAVPHVADGCTAPVHVAERYRLLSEAVARLKRQPGTRVYLDAGNPSWIADPAELADPLRRSGISRADGFALNVSNFQTLADSADYGHRLSELLGGAHFVVDTSRNGNGPYQDGHEAWCNPPGRALGTPPTTATADPLTDAYLWIKRPGESDGECRGGPPAGEWWPEYALGLASRARG